MKMGLLVLGIFLFIIGLFFCYTNWQERVGNTQACKAANDSPQYLEQLYQQIQAAKGTAQEKALSERYKSDSKAVESLIKYCAEDVAAGKFYTNIGFGIAGLGLLLAVLGFFLGRKSAREDTELSLVGD